MARRTKMEAVLRSEDLPRQDNGGARVSDLTTAGTVMQPTFHEIEIGGDPVLVTRLSTGEVVAFAAYCPHQGTSLRNGRVYGGHIRCEQHKYVYDPRTGANILPTRDAPTRALDRLKPGYLPTYAVEERDGWIHVSTRPNPPPAPDAPLPEIVGEIESVSPERVGEVPQRPPAAEPQHVEAVAGEPFELDLPTEVRPNHLWQFTSEGEVTVGQQRMEQRDDGVHYIAPVVVARPGRTEITATYTKPWGRSSLLLETRTFHVEVRAGD